MDLLRTSRTSNRASTGTGPGHGQQHGQGHRPGSGPRSGSGQGRNAGGRRFGKKRSGGRKPGGRPGQREPLGGGIYSAPMDHSYRAAPGHHDGNTHIGLGRGTSLRQAVPARRTRAAAGCRDAPTRIYAFVDDLFFLAKIQETARKMNVKVEFVKTEKDVFERMGQNGNDKPSLIIVDLNNLAAKPLTVIPKLKSKLKKETNIIGFVSHVQGELKMKATGSRLRHGAAALGVFAEPGATPAPPRAFKKKSCRNTASRV